MLNLIALLIVITIITIYTYNDFKVTDKSDKHTVVSGNSVAIAKENNYIRHIQHECGEYKESDKFIKEDYISFDEYCDKER